MRVIFRPMRVALALGFAAAALAAAPAPPLIYTEDDLGSQATFNPISHYLNLAFDTTQNPTYFTQSGYFSSHARLWERVKDPFRSIEEGGGWGRFLRDEFVGMRSIPNYSLHLLGGGYDYRWLAEWYEAREVPYPYLTAFLSSYLANIGNEAIETTASEVGPHDHVADLLVFDIVGKLLFTSDRVVTFTRHTLHMRAWHYQPMLNLRSLRIDNAGSNYVFRPRLFGESILPFFHMGLSLMAGLSFQVSGDDYLTVAGGVVPTDPLALLGDPMAGIYWDRRDALLASLTLNGSSNLRARLNVYPGVLRWQDLNIGVYLAFSKTNELFVGLNINLPAGISASF